MFGLFCRAIYRLAHLVRRSTISLTVLMPHPERVFRNVLMSWNGGDIDAYSPWMRMFRNARKWVG